MAATTFTDHQGKAWNLKIDFPIANRLKAAGKDLLDRNNIASLIGDAMIAIETMTQIAEPQYQSAGLSFEAFTDLLTHDDESFAKAMAALEAALADFFLRIGEKQLAVVVQKAVAAKQSLRKKVLETLPTLDPKLDELIDLHVQSADATIDAEIAARRKKLGDLLTQCNASSGLPASQTGHSDA